MPNLLGRGWVLTTIAATLLVYAGTGCAGEDEGAGAGSATGGMGDAGSPARPGSGGAGGFISAGGGGGGAGGTGGTSDSAAPSVDAGAGGAGDTSVTDAAGVDGAAACAPQAIDVSWLAAYESDVLARLTGKTAYAPGKLLANRGTVENRRIARDLIVQMLMDAGLTPSLHAYGTGTNVFAVLPSTTGNPERVIVGAHYDTVTNTPGASDNGTGVAAVLATARALAQVTCRARTLIFALWDQEEVGLVGSAAFANKLATEAVPVHSVHSIDQLGWDEDQDHLIELERGDPEIRQLYQAAVTALAIDVPLSATRSGSTDHESFRPRWKAIGVTEEYAGGDTSPHRHRVTDTYDTIDLNYLRTGTTIVIRVMADLMTSAP
jgi:hypothetical protein